MRGRQKPSASMTKWVEFATQLVAVVGAIAGGLVIVLPYIGRKFMTAYYGALGVPVTLTRLSVQDVTEINVSEIGGLVLLLSALAVLIPIAVTSTQIPTRHRVPPLLMAFIGIGMVFGAARIADPRCRAVILIVFIGIILFTDRRVSKLAHWLAYVVIFLTALLAAILLIELLIGYLAPNIARSRAAYSQNQFTFTTFEQLPLADPRETMLGDKTAYVYAGYNLITNNNGRNYFYRTLKDCLPETVYILTDAQVATARIDSVIVSAPDPTCRQGNAKSATPVEPATTATITP
jgi:hypothetical protein